MKLLFSKISYQKITASLIIALYALIPLYFFSHMMHMDDSQMVTMQDCPYSIGQYSVCPLDFTGHLNMWQDLTLVSVPSAVILCVLYCALYFILVYITPLVKRRLLYERQRHHIKLFYLFKELFSRGILNTKAY